MAVGRAADRLTAHTSEDLPCTTKELLRSHLFRNTVQFTGSTVLTSDTESSMYHGSSKTIETITDDGLFGGVFAAVDRAAALSHGDVLHEIESPRHLDDFELNYIIEGAWEAALEIARGDERVAEAIMTPECAALDDAEDAGEQGWEFQRLRGRLAARLGYTSIEMRDEHGPSWLCLPGCTISVSQVDVGA